MTCPDLDDDYRPAPAVWGLLMLAYSVLMAAGAAWLLWRLV